MRKADDDLLGLHTLAVLAETRSFTETAKRLGVTTSTVSRRVAELEHRHGHKLVKRTTRVVTVTKAGLALAAEAVRLATALVQRTPVVVLRVAEGATLVALEPKTRGNPNRR